ncbi:MAG: peptidoglycan-associated lipoprotein Pal [Acidobacteria bacterium]|nr:peptidoglycan-associated lipoprotein Pal [Acidobacteriota bacterium]
MKRIRLMTLAVATVLLATVLAACAKKPAPVVRPMPPPADGASAILPEPPAPPRPVDEPIPVPPEPDGIRAGDLPDDLDSLNRLGVIKPVFFDLDSSDINADGQQVLQENADTMRKNPRWQITIEGHCDERGTAEYNLALGERRALAARTYLVSLGIPAERVRTVSYGKEFPFEQGHDEAAWSKNRRAHFVITAK